MVNLAVIQRYPNAFEMAFQRFCFKEFVLTKRGTDE